MGRMEAEPLDANEAMKDPQVELARRLVARLERMLALKMHLSITTH